MFLFACSFSPAVASAAADRNLHQSGGHFLQHLREMRRDLSGYSLSKRLQCK